MPSFAQQYRVPRPREAPGGSSPARLSARRKRFTRAARAGRRGCRRRIFDVIGAGRRQRIASAAQSSPTPIVELSLEPGLDGVLVGGGDIREMVGEQRPTCARDHWSATEASDGAGHKRARRRPAARRLPKGRKRRPLPRAPRCRAARGAWGSDSTAPREREVLPRAMLRAAAPRIRRRRVPDQIRTPKPATRAVHRSSRQHRGNGRRAPRFPARRADRARCPVGVDQPLVSGSS